MLIRSTLRVSAMVTLGEQRVEERTEAAPPSILPGLEFSWAFRG
jgi:hypothetical protein